MADHMDIELNNNSEITPEEIYKLAIRAGFSEKEAGIINGSLSSETTSASAVLDNAVNETNAKLAFLHDLVEHYRENEPLLQSRGGELDQDKSLSNEKKELLAHLLKLKKLQRSTNEVQDLSEFRTNVSQLRKIEDPAALKQLVNKLVEQIRTHESTHHSDMQDWEERKDALIEDVRKHNGGKKTLFGAATQVMGNLTVKSTAKTLHHAVLSAVEVGLGEGHKAYLDQHFARANKKSAEESTSVEQSGSEEHKHQYADLMEEKAHLVYVNSAYISALPAIEQKQKLLETLRPEIVISTEQQAREEALKALTSGSNESLTSTLAPSRSGTLSSSLGDSKSLNRKQTMMSPSIATSKSLPKLKTEFDNDASISQTAYPSPPTTPGNKDRLERVQGMFTPDSANPNTSDLLRERDMAQLGFDPDLGHGKQPNVFERITKNATRTVTSALKRKPDGMLSPSELKKLEQSILNEVDNLHPPTKRHAQEPISPPPSPRIGVPPSSRNPSHSKIFELSQMIPNEELKGVVKDIEHLSNGQRNFIVGKNSNVQQRQYRVPSDLVSPETTLGSPLTLQCKNGRQTVTARTEIEHANTNGVTPTQGTKVSRR